MVRLVVGSVDTFPDQIGFALNIARIRVISSCNLAIRTIFVPFNRTSFGPARKADLLLRFCTGRVLILDRVNAVDPDSLRSGIHITDEVRHKEVCMAYKTYLLQHWNRLWASLTAVVNFIAILARLSDNMRKLRKQKLTSVMNNRHCCSPQLSRKIIKRQKIARKQCHYWIKPGGSGIVSTESETDNFLSDIVWTRLIRTNFNTNWKRSGADTVKMPLVGIAKLIEVFALHQRLSVRFCHF